MTVINIMSKIHPFYGINNKMQLMLISIYIQLFLFIV